MPIQSLSSFLPTADDVLRAELPRLSRILLIVLDSWKDVGKVYQPNCGINRGYYIAMMEGRMIGLGPPPQSGSEYGNRQPEVTAAVLEAFGWLENNNYLMRTPGQPAPDWFIMTRGGNELLRRAIRFEQWEKRGWDSVKQGLVHDPLGTIGGTPEVRQWAAEWVSMKEKQRPHEADQPTGNLQSMRIGDDSSSPELSAPLLAPEKRLPTALLSYCWESQTHKDWVKEFATRLRNDGVETRLDQWHLRAGHDRFHFMEQSVTNCEFVLIICTPNYSAKANAREGGVGYESSIITPELAGKVSQTKFVPVLRDGDWNTALPSWLKSRVGFDLRDSNYEAGYQDLLQHLHGAQASPPPIGTRPQFSAKQPQSRIAPGTRPTAPSHSNEDLKPKEIELLWTAAQDPSGQILHSQTLDGGGIRTNGRHFLQDADTRSAAEWLAALTALESRAFIEPLSSSRDFFRLTGQGYEAADRLEGFCRWDVESVLLRAHYFNAQPNEYKLTCKGVVALPAKFHVDTAADGAEMLSLIEPRTILIEGVNPPLRLEWSPNKMEFVDKATGNMQTFCVRGMQTYAGRCLKLPLDE